MNDENQRLHLILGFGCTRGERSLTALLAFTVAQFRIC
jgi:hypothetical protein